MSGSMLSSSLLKELDDLDLCILLLLLHTLEGEIILRANLVAARDPIRREDLTEKRAKPNVARQQSYDQIIQVLSPIHFCRMLRMNWCNFHRVVNVSSPRLEIVHSRCKSDCFPMKLRNHQRTTQPMHWEVFYQGKLKLQLCFASWLEQAISMSCSQLLLYILCFTKQLPGYPQHFNFLLWNGLFLKMKQLWTALQKASCQPVAGFSGSALVLYMALYLWLSVLLQAT